jgi:glycogen synthase
MPETRLKRILMTGDTVGGVWTYTLELAEALGSHGVEVVLAALGGKPTTTQRGEAGRIPRLRLLTSEFKLEWMENPWEDLAASGQWLLQLEAQYEPDLIHLNSYGHGALAFQCPVVLTAHSCVLSWWEAVRRDAVPAEWERYRREVARSLRAADALTAPSQAMLSAVERLYGPGVPEVRAVVPNGRTPHRYRASAKESFVLTAGRLWDEAKNAAAVARAAANLPWPVCLAGEDRAPNGATVDFPGCRMLGRLSADELAGWYARAAIYALPARYEPFGLSALEAALSGCALVLGDIPSLREIWQDSALYVPPDSDHQLASALRELIENPLQRENMARRAAERARTFTPERMASGFLDVCRAITSRRRAACVL